MGEVKQSVNSKNLPALRKNTLFSPIISHTQCL